MNLELTVNGTAINREVDENRTLLRFLREELGLVGTKNGCEVGHCGSCTVLVDGEAKRSCLLKLGRLSGAVVTTIEGLSGPRALGADGRPSATGSHFVQDAFLAEGAVQCGFCTPGMVLAAKALIDRNDDPSDADIAEALKNNLCRCTGYTAIRRAVKAAAAAKRGAAGTASGTAPAAPALPIVGASPRRVDAAAKAAGNAAYADDLSAPGALHGKFLFSERSRARILSIDTSAAAASGGVALVLTGKDVPGRNSFGLFVPQQPVIALDEVKYLGDVVAAVFAETEEQAVLARAKIRVEYEDLPPLLSPSENLRPGAPLVHSDTRDNVVQRYSVRKGDVEAGFAAADIVVEDTYETSAVEHAYLEPESCLAECDGNGGVVVRTGSQGSFAYRDMIAASLALPPEKVRVVMVACGGGFGGKEEPTVQIQAALAALKTGRPVKMVLSRAESIRMSTKRHPMTVYMKHGASRDGRILAMRSDVVADAGAYVSQTKPVIFRSAVTATGPYVVENVAADSVGVCTNHNPSGAFRGFGSTQACFAAEVQMDVLARKLGMDPVELRRRNGFTPGARTSTGQILGEGTAYLATLEAAAAALEHMKAEFAGQPLPAGVRRGFGIASSYKNVGIGTGISDHAGAVVELAEGGRVLVKTGAADMGQGSDTIAAQIAAEVLGCPYELVDVLSCDTALCPDGGMTTASRQSYVTGNAVKGAAEALRALIAACLAGRVPDAAVLDSVRKELLAAGTPPSAEFTYKPPRTWPHQTNADPDPARKPEEYAIHYSYCYASAAVAVEVNEETGEVKVLKVTAAQDVGKALHPGNVRGQIEGAVAMGIGLALSEEFLEDDRAVITDSLKKLGVPMIRDLPPIQAIIVEQAEADGPFGAKGIGEVGLNPVPPAISNAIYDAVGVRLRSLPMKKEKVLEAIRARR
ncbi:MAG: xanthine dehydrogenase [Treponema sp. GWB1_62_6]|nr:MAG: xanthine dehydrogenase [Treponema sp. GWC1_61_84]OHE67809.1 MAG: xanthine dehydrogenase [Treponema sp. GWB1_62_6]